MNMQGMKNGEAILEKRYKRYKKGKELYYIRTNSYEYYIMPKSVENRFMAIGSAIMLMSFYLTLSGTSIVVGSLLLLIALFTMILDTEVRFTINDDNDYMD